MDVNLVSPEGVRFKGQAKSLSLPAWDGQLGVLPGHAPMIGLLGSGEVRIDVKEGPVESFFLAGGVFMIAGVGVTLLTENCGKEPSIPKTSRIPKCWLTIRHRYQTLRSTTSSTDRSNGWSSQAGLSNPR